MLQLWQPRYVDMTNIMYVFCMEFEDWKGGHFFYFNYDYSEWVPNFLNDDFVIFLFFFNKNFSVKHQIVLKSDFSWFFNQIIVFILNLFFIFFVFVSKHLCMSLIVCSRYGFDMCFASSPVIFSNFFLNVVVPFESGTTTSSSVMVACTFFVRLFLLNIFIFILIDIKIVFDQDVFFITRVNIGVNPL